MLCVLCNGILASLKTFRDRARLHLLNRRGLRLGELLTVWARCVTVWAAHFSSSKSEHKMSSREVLTITTAITTMNSNSNNNNNSQMLSPPSPPENPHQKNFEENVKRLLHVACRAIPVQTSKHNPPGVNITVVTFSFRVFRFDFCMKNSPSLSIPSS